MDRRDALKLRLVELTGLKPTDDLMTLNWSPLIDHKLWDTFAAEIERQMDWARAWGFREGFDQESYDGTSIAPPDWTTRDPLPRR